MHEAQFHDQSAFITLTYSEEHLPPDRSLSMADYRDFWKRFRRALAPVRVRFLGCGEYGDDFGRPHYHAIVFGHAFLEDRKRHSKGKHGDQIYTSAFLDERWGLGNTYVGSVTQQSCGYVARYCVKKVTGERAAAHYQGRTPEFLTCSKGLGQAWFDQFSSDVFPDDAVIMNGRRNRVPRYYDNQLPEDLLAEYKAARIARAEKYAWNNTPARLAVREEVTKARVTSLKRDLPT